MKVEWTDELRAKAAELLRLLVKEENGILFARRNKHTRWRPVTAFTGWSADARSVSAAVAMWCGEDEGDPLGRDHRFEAYSDHLCQIVGKTPLFSVFRIKLWVHDQATPEQRLYALAKAALEEEQ